MDPTPGRDPSQGRDDGWAPRPDPTQDRFSAWDDPPPPPSTAHLPPPPPPAAQPHPQYGHYGRAPAPGGSYHPPPGNHLVFAILTTLFCFMPFGIVSIIKATSVNTLWAQGRVAEAFRASEQARNWAIAALVALPVCIGAFMLLFAVAVVSG